MSLVTILAPRTTLCPIIIKFLIFLATLSRIQFLVILAILNFPNFDFHHDQFVPRLDLPIFKVLSWIMEIHILRIKLQSKIETNHSKWGSSKKPYVSTNNSGVATTSDSIKSQGNLDLSRCYTPIQTVYARS